MRRRRFTVSFGGNNAAGTSSRSKTSPPKFDPCRFLGEQRELGLGRAGVDARRSEQRSEAGREQNEREDERTRHRAAVHSVRPRTHNPTGNGRKPTRS